MLFQGLIPSWYYGLVGLAGLRRIERGAPLPLPASGQALRRLAPRPLLMIHGGADTYIKPEMARALFGYAVRPKELWLVEGAKHNQALHVAGDEYRRRVLGVLRPTPGARTRRSHAKPRRTPRRKGGREADGPRSLQALTPLRAFA